MYHKIKTVFKRDPATNYKTLLEGEYSSPIFAYLARCDWQWTEKVDGTNIRVMFDGDRITFGGRTNRAQIPATLITRLDELFRPRLRIFRGNFTQGVCLYGEGYGPKIQKGGGNYGSKQDFVLFDVKINDSWLRREDVEEIAEMLEINYVPIIGHGTLADMVSVVKYGLQSKWGDFSAEGIVARPIIELVCNGHRVITKLKVKDFKKSKV